MPSTAPPSRVLITGVSSGIGHGLAEAYLEQDANVYGTSRRTPEDLVAHPRFRFATADLQQQAEVESALNQLLSGLDRLNLVVLNAGILGRFGDLVDVPLENMQHVMDVNVWANKRVLDYLFTRPLAIDQVVTISSGAAVNGHRGWAGYAVSKAALNMLTMLYAAERPETHFCAFAPGLVDTAMQEQLSSHAADPRYPSLETLRAKQNTPEMPGPREAARRLQPAIARLPQLVPSGSFADIRKLPEMDRDRSGHE